MGKVTLENLKQALRENNEWIQQYVYDVITNFSPSAMNVARILSHMSNRTIHITKEDRNIWDSSFERAKQYADETFSGITSLEMKEVESLPTENISKNIIYLLKTDTENVYEQYIYTGQWKSLGMTSINLDNFYTKAQVDDLLAELKSTERHVHMNFDILDATTASFTRDQQTFLNTLKNVNFDELEDHTLADRPHLSQDEREIIELLSVKLIRSLMAHYIDGDIHVSSEQTQRWNNMLDDSKRFVTEKLEAYLSVEYLSPDEEPTDPKENILYIKPAAIPTTQSQFDKYIYIDGRLEPLGGGGNPEYFDQIDFSQFVTVRALEIYVGSRVHTHQNKNVLDGITVAFTDELHDTVTRSHDHMNDDRCHLSQEEKNKLSTLEIDIETTINETFAANENDIVDILNF